MNREPAKPRRRRRVRRAANGSSRPYQRADGQWVATLSHNGKRLVRYARSEEAVIQKRDQLREQLRAGTVPTARTGTVVTVSECVRSFIAGDWAPHTKSIYESCLKHIEPALGFRPVHQVTSVEVALWLRSISEVGSRIRQISFDLLKRSFRAAGKLGLVTGNPCEGIDRPRYQREPIAPFDSHEAEQILQASAGHRIGGVFSLIFLACWRQGEVFGLQWSDINWADSLIMVRRSARRGKRGKIEMGKTKTERSVREFPMIEPIRQALLKRKAQAEAEGLTDCPLVFPAKNGSPISTTNFGKNTWKPLLKRLGLKPRGLHSGRHTAATLLLRRGVPLHTVSKIMGHTDPGTTSRYYAHILPGDAESALNLLSETLSGAKQP